MKEELLKVEVKSDPKIEIKTDIKLIEVKPKIEEKPQVK